MLVIFTNTDIMSFLWKLHNPVIPPTDYYIFILTYTVFWTKLPLVLVAFGNFSD